MFASAILLCVALFRNVDARRVKGNFVLIGLIGTQAGPSQLSRLAQRPLREEGWPVLPYAVEGKAKTNESSPMLVNPFSKVVSPFRGFLGRHELTLEPTLMRRDDPPTWSSSERIRNIVNALMGKRCGKLNDTETICSMRQIFFASFSTDMICSMR